MPQNIGTLNRTARIDLGLVLLSLVFVGPKTLCGLLGLIPLVTGLARFCPPIASRVSTRVERRAVDGA